MNNAILTQLKQAEVKYTYALHKGNPEVALLRNRQIYQGLWTLYQESKDSEGKVEMAHELERLAEQGQLLERFINQLNQPEETA